MKRNITGLLIILYVLFALSGMVLADDNDGKFNLNTVTKDELVSIGIDPEIADGILELREENGEFVAIEELLDVDGVTPEMLRDLKQNVYIESAAGCNC